MSAAAAPGPPGDEKARAPTGGVSAAPRLLAVSFGALALALIVEAARPPPLLPAGAVAPPVPPPAPVDEPRPSGPLVVVACGALDPAYALRRHRVGAGDPPDLFAPLAPLLEPAHFRLLGIESIDPASPGALAVTGPPVSDEGAKLVALGRFDLAALGHAEPTRGGRRGLLESAERLRAAGVSPLGAAETADEALGPLRLLVEGRRVAWLALDAPEAGAAKRPDGPDELARRLAALREEGEADAVVVTVHAGDRYAALPTERTRRLFRAIADAGADVVLGLRPALVQGVEWWRGVPLVYGLGNPFSPSDREHPEAGVSALARLRFDGKGPPAVELCPVRSDGRALAPLASDHFRYSYEPGLWQRLRLSARHLDGFALGPVGADGCAPVGPPAPPSGPRPRDAAPPPSAPGPRPR